MKIEQSTVRKLLISGVDQLDPLTVIIEEFKLGECRVIITCYGDSWTAYWGSMGGTLAEFFARTSPCYLVGCFAPALQSIISDAEGLPSFLRKEIINQRRKKDIDKRTARELFDNVWDMGSPNEDKSLMDDIFGNEWWFTDFPTITNPNYEYLTRIVEAVQAAVKETHEITPIV